jgi:demethylmenaquinone methyltransferase/2-methoxy-6-polyprenyl-1,4-benzoquinol methylase
MDDDLLEEQRAFYRARAPEYDEWWQRRGRYDRGEDETREWHHQVDIVDAALASFDAQGDVLELAGGTGWWTQRLANTAHHLTVVDASPEAVAINHERVRRTDVDYTVADVFGWWPCHKAEKPLAANSCACGVSSDPVRSSLLEQSSLMSIRLGRGGSLPEVAPRAW